MNDNICFVMMPFGQPYEEYYTQIYVPAIEKNNLLPRRADSLYRPSPILHDIWDFISRSTLIVADITGRNPNVMYELGLAHAIAKPAIIISNNIEDVPFDLRSLRILLYDVNKPNWGTELSNAIQNSIKEIIVSPIDAVLPTFIKIRPTKQEDVSDLKRDVIEIKQYLYKINEEIEYSLTRPPTSNILDREDYAKAVKEANELYFNGGLDLSEIKEAIIKKYNTTYEAAADIIDIARGR